MTDFRIVKHWRSREIGLFETPGTGFVLDSRTVPGSRDPRGGAAPLILIVDDNLDAREMYAMYLQHEGFRVLEAQNGHEAVEKTRSERPSLVLMDASMPRLDGWDAVKQLKADPRTRAIPVLMLTGHAYDEHRARAASVGADGFLAKPVLPDELAREVRRVLQIS